MAKLFSTKENIDDMLCERVSDKEVSKGSSHEKGDGAEQSLENK